eukprot:1394-Ditylum_brightwellii.AAC.1
MASTEVDTIIAAFTHPNIPRNTEEPNFELIQAVHKLLNQNATGILRGTYGNTLGMLGLTITPTAYHTLAGADFVTPTQPANSSYSTLCFERTNNRNYVHI